LDQAGVDLSIEDIVVDPKTGLVSSVVGNTGAISRLANKSAQAGLISEGQANQIGTGVSSVDAMVDLLGEEATTDLIVKSMSKKNAANSNSELEMAVTEELEEDEDETIYIMDPSSG